MADNTSSPDPELPERIWIDRLNKVKRDAGDIYEFVLAAKDAGSLSGESFLEALCQISIKSARPASRTALEDIHKIANTAVAHALNKEDATRTGSTSPDPEKVRAIRREQDRRLAETLTEAEYLGDIDTLLTALDARPSVWSAAMEIAKCGECGHSGEVNERGNCERLIAKNLGSGTFHDPCGCHCVFPSGETVAVAHHANCLARTTLSNIHCNCAEAQSGAPNDTLHEVILRGWGVCVLHGLVENSHRCRDYDGEEFGISIHRIKDTMRDSHVAEIEAVWELVTRLLETALSNPPSMTASEGLYAALVLTEKAKAKALAPSQLTQPEQEKIKS